MTATRSLRNEIARHLLEGYEATVPVMRRRLEDAQVAITACQAFALVHGDGTLLERLWEA